ncbi:MULTISPECIES: BACON domain-containing protein [Niastella]|uniref:BACON domain-containing protein n=1 Tax=Niastella soli TaxID=2821487 RepID=A0ABS3YNS7_9BACT|nr:BACON domain-containing protein [Niastella soli]MBO9199546.1 BACON domain-containing protein [Niastella soli]
MKKFFLALAMCQVLISCGKKNDPPDDLTNDAPNNEPYLHFYQTTVSIPPFVTGSADLVIESNIDWQISVTSGADWLQVNKSSGHGKDTIHASIINENVGSQARTAIIAATVTNPSLNLQAQLTVEQKPYKLQVLSEKRITGYPLIYGHGMTPAFDGGCLLIGTGNWGDMWAHDAWMARLNRNGDTVWTRQMGDANIVEDAIAAIATFDGGFIIAAQAYRSTGNLWLIKLKSNGDTAWTRSADITEFVNTIAATADGGFVVAGATGSDMAIAKFSSSGIPEWQKRFGGSGSEQANAVSVAIDGSIYVTGNSTSNNSGDVGKNHGSKDYWVVKLNSNGDMIWSKLFGGDNSDESFSIKSTVDGGCIVAGVSYSSENGDVTGKNQGNGDMWVLKLDANGNITWNNLLGGTYLETIKANTSIALTPDGGYILAGITTSNDGDVGEGQGSGDSWVFKLNKKGQKVWSETLGGHMQENTIDIVMNIDGSFWLAGWTNPNGSTYPPFVGTWFLKLKDY